MLRVRQEPLERFQPLVDENFIERLIDYAREEWPELAGELPSPMLRAMAECSVEEAHRLGLVWEQSCAAFLGLMLEVSPTSLPCGIWPWSFWAPSRCPSKP